MIEGNLALSKRSCKECILLIVDSQATAHAEMRSKNSTSTPASHKQTGTQWYIKKGAQPPRLAHDFSIDRLRTHRIRRFKWPCTRKAQWRARLCSKLKGFAEFLSEFLNLPTGKTQNFRGVAPAASASFLPASRRALVVHGGSTAASAAGPNRKKKSVESRAATLASVSNQTRPSPGE